MNGTRTPKMKNIDMLCEYFGVQSRALMKVDGERKTTKITPEQAELIQLTVQSSPENVRLVLEMLKRLEGVT
jgi:hypothetical protein